LLVRNEKAGMKKPRRRLHGTGRIERFD